MYPSSQLVQALRDLCITLGCANRHLLVIVDVTLELVDLLDDVLGHVLLEVCYPLERFIDFHLGCFQLFRYLLHVHVSLLQSIDQFHVRFCLTSQFLDLLQLGLDLVSPVIHFIIDSS